MKTISELDRNILVYINHLLPAKKFHLSYEDLQNAIVKTSGKKFGIGTLRKEFSLLKKSGLITTKLRYRKPVPILSLDGKLAISTTLAYRRFGPWDGKWRVVIANIPENDKKFRLKFQQRLKEIGFEKMARSIFVSAHPLLSSAKRIASQYALDGNCIFLEASKIENQNRAVEKIWKTDEINKQYNQFIKKAERSLKKKPTEIWPFIAKQLELEFALIYKHDPHLPEELLPKDWQSDLAYKKYKEIVRSY